jgi:hypothetical protein
LGRLAACWNGEKGISYSGGTITSETVLLSPFHLKEKENPDSKMV